MKKLDDYQQIFCKEVGESPSEEKIKNWVEKQFIKQFDNEMIIKYIQNLVSHEFQKTNDIIKNEQRLFEDFVEFQKDYFDNYECSPSKISKAEIMDRNIKIDSDEDENDTKSHIM